MYAASKRLLALFLALLLCLSLLPAALAEGAAVPGDPGDGEGELSETPDPEEDPGAPAEDEAPGEPEDEPAAPPPAGDELQEVTASGTCGDNLTWTLEDGVLTISGYGAMYSWSTINSVSWYSYRSRITSVLLPDGLTTIGCGSFCGCSLRSVTIPESVTRIEDSVFQDCSSLSSVTIPANVTSIGSYAFYRCSSLTAITVEADNANYCSQDGILYDKAMSTLICCPCNHPSVSVTIPNSVTSIGSYAFYRCSSLSSVTIPDSVTSIDNYAFEYCSSLTSVTIPDSVTSINLYTFAGCSSLSSVTIPNSVTSIGSYAFSGCSSLSSVTIPDSVTSIGNYAFEYCSSLTSVTIPDSVTSIGFCTFEYCSSLTSVTILAGVTSIGDYAFSHCKGLTSVTIPDSVTSIGFCTFEYCSSLTSVTIPGSVTSIGGFAFGGCSNLTSVTILAGVTSIGHSAFSGCSSLTSVTIPDSVTSIGHYAFDCCSNLSSVTIPDSVTSIGYYAFEYCSSLTSVTIPDSVTSIGDYAFKGCSSLTEIWFKGPAPAFNGDYVFNDVTATAYYPADDPTWTASVRQNYGGTITWAPYSGFSTGNVGNIDLDNFALVVYENQNPGTAQKDRYRLAAGVTVTIGSDTYTTDEKGAVTVKLSDSATFEKTDYVTRTLTVEQLIQNNAVYLEEETPPAILAVWHREDGGADTDVRRQTLSLDPQAASYAFEPEIYWGGSGAGRLFLYQEGTQVELALTGGAFTLNSADFDLTKDLFLVAEDGEGHTSSRKLSLELGTHVPVELDGLTLKFDGSLSVTLPESAGILAGTKLKLKMPALIPFKAELEDNKWYLAIGYVDAGSYSQEDGWTAKSWSEQMKKFKGSLSSASTELEKLAKAREQMKLLGKKACMLEGSFGIDGSMTVMGFAEGYLDEAGKMVLSNSGIYVLFSASADYTQPFLLGPVPAFFELSLGNDFAAQLNLALQNGSKELTVSLDLEDTLSLSGGVGIGVNKVASVSGGLKGELINHLIFESGVLHYYQLKAALKWYIKLKALAFTWEKSDDIASAVWYEWPESGSQSETGDYAPNIYDEMFDTSQYRPDDLRYLRTGSPMLPESAGLLRADQPLRGGAPFLANAYEGADPQTLRFADGAVLAVWIGYNDAHIGFDGLQLYYAFFDGEAWSDPQPVDDDGTMDAAPSLALCGDTALLIWQNSCDQLPGEATLDEVAGMMGISAARFDRNSGWLETQDLLAANGAWNAEPVICSDGSTTFAVWRQNTAGDIFGLSGDESILFSTLTDGAWSTPGVLYAAQGPILSLAAEASGGGLSVAWCCDTDGDLGTSDDLEVFRDGARLTENEWVDSGVVFSGGSLFWYSGGTLVADGSPILPESAAVGSDRFQVVSGDGALAIVYAETDGLATILKAIVYDTAAGSWSYPLPVSGGGTSVPYFSASFRAGELSVLMENQAITGQLGEDDPYGVCSLQWYNIPLSCDIAVTELYHDNSSYVEGKDMVFTVSVQNRGLLTVDTLLAEVLDEDGAVLASRQISKTILPGAEKQIETGFRVHSIEQGKTVTVRVTPAGQIDADPDNNSAEATLKWNDLAVENSRYGVSADGVYILHTSIVNRGYDTQRQILVELHKSTPDGELVDQVTVAELQPFHVTALSFSVGTAPTEAYYIVIADREDDDNRGNDTEFVRLIPEEQPTVRVSLDAAGGSVSPASVEIGAGAAIGDLPEPTREGWLFLGWFTEPAENVFVAGEGTPVTAETPFSEDTTVYAHWRLPGDINGDGKVNNKDVTRLQKYMKGDEVEVVTLNLDTNGDGKVNNKDVTRLQRYMKDSGTEIH